MRIRHIQLLRYKATILLMSILMLVVVIGAVALFISHTKKPKKIDAAQVSEVTEINDCNKGLTKLADVEANPGQINESISLLSYRAFCLSDIGKYEESVTAFRELKEYYNKQGDKLRAKDVDTYIAEAQKAMKSPRASEPSRIPGGGEPKEDVEAALKAIESERQ